MRRVIPFLVCVFCLPGLARGQSNSSVLATGQWYKIGVTKPGLHQLDATFLRNAGITLGKINPQHIQLFGNGGGMLPQANAAQRLDDLTENAIFVAGEADGRFDNEDYVLFYAQGPHEVLYTGDKFTHRTNLYSDTAFYFLTIGEAPGLRPAAQASAAGATVTVTTFDDYLFHEKDQTNLIQSGREWYGERFDVTTEHTVGFSVPGLVAEVPVEVTVAAMAAGSAASQFAVKLNGLGVGTFSAPGIGQGTYDVKGANATGSFAASTAGPNVSVSVSFVKNGNNVGYLNWIGLRAKRELKLYGNQTTFQSVSSLSNATVEYRIADLPADAQIWDVTNPLLPLGQSFALNGNAASFGASGGALRQYVAFRGNTFDKPVSIGAIPNQNLHNLAAPDMVIITSSGFGAAAARLAAFRREHDGLRVEVVTPGQIYNEFSSGRQDVTAIRDFIRFLHRQGNSLKYALLLGDASYDYKDRLAGNTNLVPTYESNQSLHPIFSFSSDDYFGFMDDGEGEWQETTTGDHTLDVGIGRLPVKTAGEAAAVVGKLVGYASNAAALGAWRNRLCFVADDGDGNTHQLDAERLTSQIGNRYKAFNIDKIFLDAFPQTSTPSGQTAPSVRDAIDKAVNQGHLIINYTGHGGEVGWAQEQILDIPQITAWQNGNRLPLLVTATCEFGRYDDPGVVSGAEFAVLNDKGGAIGLITTTRPVFSNTNYALNVAFYNAIFEPTDGRMPRLGDAMRATKNNSLNGSINRNFSLLGDPSMRLAYPREGVALTRINDQPLAGVTDTLKALGRVTLEGEIRRSDGSRIEDFNGTLFVTLYDKPRDVTTRGDENPKMLFTLADNRLYEGKASVRNGLFKFNLVVPKDMDYRLGSGRISLYAQQTDGLLDAGGVDQTIPLGGSATGGPADGMPPDIALFFNDTTFASGGLTGPNALLIARLRDDNGINLSGSGIGHEITARLDDSDELFVLNEFYEPSLDNFTAGEIRFLLRNLSPGKHQLAITAWDTHNNPATATLEFVVSGAIHLRKVVNYPNPFHQYTTFRYEHDRPYEAVEAEISVFTTTGALVYNRSSVRTLGIGDAGEMTWDGTGKDGKKLEPGVYVYRLSVRSKADNAVTTYRNRLVLVQ
jgi:hypothetical protein